MLFFPRCTHARLNKKDNKSRRGEGETCSPISRFQSSSEDGQLASIWKEEAGYETVLFDRFVGMGADSFSSSSDCFSSSMYGLVSMAGREKSSTELRKIGGDPNLTCRLRECVALHYQNRFFL